ncbi:hypothetical protein CC79DRAFT_921752 [Sarocladium strictum]
MISPSSPGPHRHPPPAGLHVPSGALIILLLHCHLHGSNQTLWTTQPLSSVPRRTLSTAINYPHCQHVAILECNLAPPQLVLTCVITARRS